MMAKQRITRTPGSTELMRKVAVVAAWLLGGGTLVLAVFVLSFYMAMKVEMRSTEVVVPDIEGLLQDEAAARVEPLGLVLEVVDRRHDPAIASGRILQQEPLGGSRVRRGRKLKLVLSLGGKILTVPDLTGKADRAVAIELRRDGFATGDQARVGSWDVPTGRVLAQVPSAGSPGVPNTRVHRLVSDGSPDPAWVMPDLTGRTRDQVERWIRLSGFRQGLVRKLRSRRDVPGTVIGQFPLAGYPIRRNDIVELTVAQ